MLSNDDSHLPILQIEHFALVHIRSVSWQGRLRHLMRMYIESSVYAFFYSEPAQYNNIIAPYNNIIAPSASPYAYPPQKPGFLVAFHSKGSKANRSYIYATETRFGGKKAMPNLFQPSK